MFASRRGPADPEPPDAPGRDRPGGRGDPIRRDGRDRGLPRRPVDPRLDGRPRPRARRCSPPTGSRRFGSPSRPCSRGRPAATGPELYRVVEPAERLLAMTNPFTLRPPGPVELLRMAALLTIAGAAFASWPSSRCGRYSGADGEGPGEGEGGGSGPGRRSATTRWGGRSATLRGRSGSWAARCGSSWACSARPGDRDRRDERAGVPGYLYLRLR